jgi:Arc/MetJ family transcription regulator
MRANIVLDERLVAEGMRLTGAKTKRELIHRALTELVERRRPKDLSELAGQIRFRDDYDYQALRRSGFDEDREPTSGRQGGGRASSTHHSG